MNKTVTVNIGGIVFHIDENAYDRFRQYLESVRMHFTASEGRDEIMQDIENRIAEMFQERIRDSKQVITIFDVDDVTSMMGRPEQIGDEASDMSGESEPAAPASSIKRRLFRDPDDKVFGGVCSGIGAYFNIDPVWIRLIFAAAFLLYGGGILLYIILWIIIPKAETTADKLQMKGEPVNISNIGKNVQEEMNQVKQRLSDLGKGKRSNGLGRFFDALGQVIRFFFLFVAKVLAAAIVLFGLLVLFLIFVSILAVFNVPGIEYPEVINRVFSHDYQIGLALLGAILVVGIPVLMLAYAGIRILFNLGRTSRNVKLIAGGLWLTGIVLCTLLGFSLAHEFSEKQSVRKEIPVEQPANGTLYLDIQKDLRQEKDYDRWDYDEWEGDLRLSLKDGRLQSKDIRLDIVDSPDDSFHLIQVCRARGSSRKSAADHASRIVYSYAQNDSVISFDPYFIIDKEEKFRAQRMQLILQVPVGGKVYLDKSLRRFIYDIKNVQNILDHDMLNRTWIMKEDGLHCVDCKGDEATIGGRFLNISDSSDNSGIRIDDDGIRIEGPQDEVISISKDGIYIKKDGKTKVIRKGDYKLEVSE